MINTNEDYLQVFEIIKFDRNYEMWLTDAVIVKSENICSKEKALEFYMNSRNLYKSDLNNTRCFSRTIEK